MKKFTITYLRNQIEVGNVHYYKVLKEVIPHNLYRYHMILNPIIGKYFALPLIIFYYIDALFNILDPTISKSVGLIIILTIFYFGIWELIISIYTLPNWKRFIVRNSPVQDVASALSLVKVAKSPVIGACVVCFGIGVVGNEIHKELWPKATPPAAKLGSYVSKVTGYNPK